MPDAISKRKAEEEDWATHRTAILTLYVEQNRTLRETMAVMADIGFVKTLVYQAPEETTRANLR